MKKYTKINQDTINRWVNEDWEWSRPISHEEYLEAKKNNYQMYLTPTKAVPKSWIPDIKGKDVLGFASGGGQQCPILKALGANVICLDYSQNQLAKETEVAKREGYEIKLVCADFTLKLPFADETFDFIVAPVSLCYAEEIEPIFKELNRILKLNGEMIIGLDNGINYLFDDEHDEELIVKFSLPFNPLKDKTYLKYLIDNDYGIQFSHSLEESIGGLLHSGFMLLDIYEDYNEEGLLRDKNIPAFYSLRLKKELN